MAPTSKEGDINRVTVCIDNVDELNAHRFRLWAIDAMRSPEDFLEMLLLVYAQQHKPYGNRNLSITNEEVRQTLALEARGARHKSTLQDTLSIKEYNNNDN